MLMSIHRIYLFTRFERFWHWSQATLVIVLLVTGFSIHGYLGGLDFQLVILIHSYAAWLLITLWIFAIFWHITTGEWKQYIPTTQKITLVARHYAWGMFRGEQHPFHQTADHKHNPLQRLAYLWLKLMINPMIWVSGILLLFFSYNWLSLMPFGLTLTMVAWVHTAAAYMMLVFFIAHVYLATTGHTPLSHIRAMMTGWDNGDEVPDTKDSPL